MTPLLKTERLAKHFDGVTALDNVSISLGTSEILGIFGTNGAGKTTLFNVITGMIKADSGHVFLDGHHLDGVPAHRIPRMGVVRTFQNLRLVRQASLLENLLLFHQSQPGEHLLNLFFRPAMCKRNEQQATEKAMLLLNRIGLVSVYADKAETLSYGQQKLLSIACCLMAESRVLLLDEPMAGIAPQMIEAMQLLIREAVGSGRSVILVEHNIPVLATLCQRLVFMDSGRVICEGRPEEVLGQQSVIDAYLR